MSSQQDPLLEVVSIGDGEDKLPKLRRQGKASFQASDIKPCHTLMARNREATRRFVERRRKMNHTAPETIPKNNGAIPLGYIPVNAVALANEALLRVEDIANSLERNVASLKTLPASLVLLRRNLVAAKKRLTMKQAKSG